MRTEGPGWLRPLIHDKRDGPLPALLLGLTVLTGLVDAVSILSLGRVFVANMTGNVVFIGFALAGAPGFSLAASVSALGGFLAGAGLGGRLAFRFGHDRGRLLFVATSVELVCVGVGLLIVGLEANPLPGVARDGAAAVVAVALGAQNAAVRALAIPDLTTTVLTMTLTGLAADVRAGLGPAVIRRFLAVVTMFGGAAIGALLDLKVSPAAALGAAVAVLFAVTVATVASTRRGQLLNRAPG